jgi:Xaa-Pro aminopeptidase
METGTRLQKLRRKLSESNLDALLISQPDNIFYLSDCEGLEGYLLVTQDTFVVVTDFRYIEQVERQSPNCRICRITGKMEDWLPDLLAGLPLQRLGFESSHLSFAAYQQISEIMQRARPDLELVPAKGLVEALRMVKDRDEIDLIVKAARIADAAFAHIEKVIRAGMTEKELAWELERFLRENGSQTVPFEIIVASGANAALPHARPSDYQIREGEPVVIDFGAKYNGYGSDLTRTLCAGQPDTTFKRVYDIVLNAQQAAISGIRSGMTGQEADAIAREVIRNAGYGDAFGHSLGHGIGLVTHEGPRLGPNSSDVLADGMVFTVEPGIYLSGWGGIRIEDDVVLENGTIRVISSARK